MSLTLETATVPLDSAGLRFPLLSLQQVKTALQDGDDRARLGMREEGAFAAARDGDARFRVLRAA